MSGLGFIRIMFVIALSSFCAMAQIQQPAAGTDKPETPSTGSITGRVVNESGEPLENAIVRISVVGRDNNSEAPVATDRDGKFKFEGLESSLAYYINASMSAYTPLQRKPEATQPAQPPTYRVGDSATLTLTKGAVITGKVTTATGDPLVGIGVRAEMVLRGPNGRRLLNGLGHERQTDDRGVYRIFGLPAGRYVVMAGGASLSYSGPLLGFEEDGRRRFSSEDASAS